MASVNVVLRKKKNSEGKYPISIRVTKDRKSSFIHIGQYIKESDWDDKKRVVRKSHPNSTRLNNLIIKKLAEANEMYLNMEGQDKVVSAKQVQKKIKNDTSEVSYFDVAKQYLENLQKNESFTVLSADKAKIEHFRKFTKKEIEFKDITQSLLEKFQIYLKKKKGLSERSVVNNLINIRTIFNMAIRDGIVEQKYYPFGKGKIVLKFPDSVKIGLTAEEVKQFEAVQLEEGSLMWHTRNVWLTSFYFAGMRVSDVLRLKWSDFIDGRLHYIMGKNQKQGSLKISEKALEIFKQYEVYKDSENDFVFTDLKKADLTDAKDVVRKISNAVKVFNKYLKEIAVLAEIEKKITMHIARHTFGNISGDKIPIQMLQRLYRHSSVTTTIGYQSNFIFKDTDDALDSVIN